MESTPVRFIESLGLLNEYINKENATFFDGITGRQLMVLAGIASTDKPLTLCETANLCGGSYQSMKTILIRLEERGLVEMRQNKADLRKYIIHTTAKGEALAEEVSAQITRAQNRLGEQLSTEELETFIKVVDTLIRGKGYLGAFNVT